MQGIQDFDPEDVRVGRAVITRGLVAPGDVLEALEEQAREAELGRSVRLADILIQRKKIAKSQVDSLGTAVATVRLARPTSDADGPAWQKIQEGQRIPTLKVRDAFWREIGDADPIFLQSTSLVEPESLSSDMLVLVDAPPEPKPAPSTPAGGMPRIGRKVGPWIIEKEIGRGGMGIIFRAHHATRPEVAAVKVLKDPTRTSAIERFTREAAAVQRLEHPSIVRILDAGLEGYCPYFAMELVEGRPLSQVIRQRILGPYEAVEALRDVARAIHHAHEQGVLHRDLKPSNIIIQDDGRVKVMDFGLAKIEDDSQSLTRPGAAVGTPAYMSPEQALGFPVDRRTDVFALGVVLYESVAHKLPWPPERLTRIAAGDRIVVPRMRNGDPVLEAIVTRATRRGPEERFESAEAFARELDAWLAGSIPPSRRLRAQVARLAKLPRHAELAIAALGGAVFVLGLTHAVFGRPPAKQDAVVAVEVQTAPPPQPPRLEPVAFLSPPPPSTRERPIATAPAPSVEVTEVAASDPQLVQDVVRRIQAKTEVVSVEARECRLEDVAVLPDDPADAALAHTKAGRSVLLAALPRLPDFESFDETTLTLRFKKRGKLPLQRIDAGWLPYLIKGAEDRRDAATYLRARGLTGLAQPLER